MGICVWRQWHYGWPNTIADLEWLQLVFCPPPMILFVVMTIGHAHLIGLRWLIHFGISPSEVKCLEQTQTYIHASARRVCTKRCIGESKVTKWSPVQTPRAPLNHRGMRWHTEIKREKSRPWCRFGVGVLIHLACGAVTIDSYGLNRYGLGMCCVVLVHWDMWLGVRRFMWPIRKRNGKSSTVKYPSCLAVFTIELTNYNYKTQITRIQHANNTWAKLTLTISGSKYGCCQAGFPVWFPSTKIYIKYNLFLFIKKKKKGSN